MPDLATLLKSNPITAAANQQANPQSNKDNPTPAADTSSKITPTPAATIPAAPVDKSWNASAPGSVGNAPVAPVIPTPTGNSKITPEQQAAIDKNTKATLDVKDPTNQADAYAQLSSQAGDEISRIESYYNSILNEETRNGVGRESASNAMALASHMAGSGTAMAALDTEKGVTKANKEATTGLLANAIAGVYSNIRQNSITLAAQGQAELASANAMGKEMTDKVKKDAMDGLDVFAGGGISAEKIKEQDPQLYEDLKTQSGMSDYQMDTYLKNKMPTQYQPVTKDIYMAGPDGKTTILKRITVDPITKKSTEQDFTINAPLAEVNPDSLIKGADGSLWQMQNDGTAKNITPGSQTTNQKDYEYYVNQTKTAGKTPLSFEDWTANSKAPAAVKEYLAAKAGGFTGTILDYQMQKKGFGATLDADTINFLADQYISSPGTAIPSFGMGAAGWAMRAQFYSAVAQQATAKGLTGQALAAQKAASTAAQSGLTKMQTLYSTTQAAEQTAKKNLDYALTLGKDYNQQTMFPAGNRFINWLSGNVGNVKLTAFETALYTGAREYAKVASGAAGSVAGLTDSATKEAESMINSAMTQGQLESTIATMKQDMENVKTSQSDSIVNLNDIIANGGTGGTANLTPPVTPNNPNGGNSGGPSSGDSSFDDIWK